MPRRPPPIYPSDLGSGRDRRIIVAGFSALMCVFAHFTARADGGSVGVDARFISNWRVPSTTAAAMIHGAAPGGGATAGDPPAAGFASGAIPSTSDSALEILESQRPEAAAQLIRQTPALGGSLMIEMPRAAADGTIQQPRYSLGFAAPRLRSMLQALGVDAERCMAPVLRAHAHFGSSPNATVMLTARCSIR
ncbi:MAG TPA: hypothetical protein VMU33_13700 [Burkholderiaceae bacterium]|nr:hypothetical protein [Burkholderiaceae bacterium]